MNELTRKDLDDALDKQELRFEKHLDAKLAPMADNVKCLQRTVYGRTGSNGLTGSVKVLKWGYALLAGVMIFFAQEDSNNIATFLLCRTISLFKNRVHPNRNGTGTL